MINKREHHGTEVREVGRGQVSARICELSQVAGNSDFILSPLKIKCGYVTLSVKIG